MINLQKSIEIHLSIDYPLIDGIYIYIYIISTYRGQGDDPRHPGLCGDCLYVSFCTPCAITQAMCATKFRGWNWQISMDFLVGYLWKIYGKWIFLLKYGILLRWTMGNLWENRWKMDGNSVDGMECRIFRRAFVVFAQFVGEFDGRIITGSPLIKTALAENTHDSSTKILWGMVWNLDLRKIKIRIILRYHFR